MPYDYVTVDVFTDRPFGGNPLAVVLDARGLGDAEMQAIAAEFNFAETTFLLPPEDRAHTARVRIFTPRSEVPFAGHPNVGTGFVVAALGRIFGRDAGRRLVFEEKAGLVPIDILSQDGAPVGATLTAPQALTRGPEFAAALVAECVGLDEADIRLDRHAPVAVSVGMAFIVAELRDGAALARAQPSPAGFTRHLPADGAVSIHLYVRDAAQDGMALRARMFSPLLGVWEDPATGSANAALAALLAELAPAADLSLSLRIVQGVEMGRPSLLEASVEKSGGKLGAVRIGGRCVRMMAGRLDPGGR